MLHTPGGSPNAAEAAVAYLRSKFDRIEVVVPTLAMSAGTMVALSADEVIMGRQSQLGPIDPQILVPGAQKYISSAAIIGQFRDAERAILGNPETGEPGDQGAAHLYAPILQTLGYGLLKEAENAEHYGRQMVTEWLTQYMFSGLDNAAQRAEEVAGYFSDAENHRSHGRRIGRDACRDQDLVISDLEDSQDLQEAVLTAYHLMTLYFEQTAAVKLLNADTGQAWMKQAGAGQ